MAGSVHDSTIFDNSSIKTRMENKEFGSGLILGDSSYPCLPYLLTPLQNPTTPAEVLYNESQIRTRSMVERCFGVLVKQFSVLSRGSRFWTPQKTMPLIVACAVLHNIIRLSTTNEDNFNPDSLYNVNREADNNNLHDNERAFLIDSHFQKLL
ncbi:putative nuclease HARBI1 [Prorops nasuta]|uniref:putative nuclease HARBI1 n=1 Tax=Prorops nasuta TaxID=863751 RepID=UPI0034CD27A2